MQGSVSSGIARIQNASIKSDATLDVQPRRATFIPHCVHIVRPAPGKTSSWCSFKRRQVVETASSRNAATRETGGAGPSLSIKNCSVIRDRCFSRSCILILYQSLRRKKACRQSKSCIIVLHNNDFAQKNTGCRPPGHARVVGGRICKACRNSPLER